MHSAHASAALIKHIKLIYVVVFTLRLWFYRVSGKELPRQKSWRFDSFRCVHAHDMHRTARPLHFNKSHFRRRRNRRTPIRMLATFAHSRDGWLFSRIKQTLCKTAKPEPLLTFPHESLPSGTISHTPLGSLHSRRKMIKSHIGLISLLRICPCIHVFWLVSLSICTANVIMVYASDAVPHNKLIKPVYKWTKLHQPKMQTLAPRCVGVDKRRTRTARAKADFELLHFMVGYTIFALYRSNFSQL